MGWLTNKRLGVKLLSICNELKNGFYELKRNTKNNNYYVVLYDCNNIGVFSGMYNIEHKHLTDGLIRLMETINMINKM